MPSALPIPQKPVDLGLIVALQEEFREFIHLSDSYETNHDNDLISYHFHRGSYHIVATFVGAKGQAEAMRVTERLISSWDPACVVVMGVTGGLHVDLRVGDVHVPSQAVQYFDDGKAVPSDDETPGFMIVPGAPAYRPDHALLEAVQHLEFNHQKVYKEFRAACSADLELLIPQATVRDRLFAEDLVRREVNILSDGHVGTGPVVGAAPAFAENIRKHDRNIKSLEMESAAVLIAAQKRNKPKPALMIRGISDYGDDRKTALDNLGGGALRKYAMRNAVRLLWALLDTKALPNPQ